MSAPTAWALPTVAVLNGRQYPINTDYRDILEILAWLNGDEGGELSQEERCYVALRLFYRDFGAIPRQDWQEAAEFLSVFLSGGRPDRAAPGPPAAGLAAGRAAHCGGGEQGGRAGDTRHAIPALVDLSQLL